MGVPVSVSRCLPAEYPTPSFSFPSTYSTSSSMRPLRPLMISPSYSTTPHRLLPSNFQSPRSYSFSHQCLHQQRGIIVPAQLLCRLGSFTRTPRFIEGPSPLVCVSLRSGSVFRVRIPTTFGHVRHLVRMLGFFDVLSVVRKISARGLICTAFSSGCSSRFSSTRIFAVFQRLHESVVLLLRPPLALFRYRVWQRCVWAFGRSPCDASAGSVVGVGVVVVVVDKMHHIGLETGVPWHFFPKFHLLLLLKSRRFPPVRLSSSSRRRWSR